MGGVWPTDCGLFVFDCRLVFLFLFSHTETPREGCLDGICTSCLFSSFFFFLLVLVVVVVSSFSLFTRLAAFQPGYLTGSNSQSLSDHERRTAQQHKNLDWYEGYMEGGGWKVRVTGKDDLIWCVLFRMVWFAVGTFLLIDYYPFLSFNYLVGI